LIVALSLIAALTSCEKSGVYERNWPINDQAWTYDAVQQFDIEVSDTTIPHNVFVNIRHSDRFEWANLWLRMTTTYPGGQAFERRLDIPLARPDGSWLGVCTGELCFHQQLIQAGVVFPRSGTYSFSLEQDMRTDSVYGVFNVGMRIEQVRNMTPATGAQRTGSAAER
jgi:gliding motility-associated lipoprotein GldH